MLWMEKDLLFLKGNTSLEMLVIQIVTTYYLKETLLALQKPKNPKELFNLRHSSLRNVIERIFGVAKKRLDYQEY